uniref:Uncharacterized protein n=1 Tax=Plectus sambesii TaxID=2011161 RepID=A0A914WDQ2_9BILA
MGVEVAWPKRPWEAAATVTRPWTTCRVGGASARTPEGGRRIPPPGCRPTTTLTTDIGRGRRVSWMTSKFSARFRTFWSQSGHCRLSADFCGGAECSDETPVCKYLVFISDCATEVSAIGYVPNRRLTEIASAQ